MIFRESVYTVSILAGGIKVDRFWKITGGCGALLMGMVWLYCGIYADLNRDGYDGVLLAVGFYCLWIWMGGKYIAAAGLPYESVRKWVTFLWFLGYLYLLFRFTLFEPAYHRELQFLWTAEKEKRIQYLQENINLIPFRSLCLFWRALRYDYLPWKVCIANLLGNLIVFVPMPWFFADFICRKRMIPSLLFTGLTVFLVEIIQLLAMCGSADVDDLFLNMLGSGFGVVFVKGFLRKLRVK